MVFNGPNRRRIAVGSEGLCMVAIDSKDRIETR